MEIKRAAMESTVFSPFGRKIRSFTDSGPDGKDVEFPRGTSLYELARRLYGTHDVAPFEGRFSFLDRDNKERDYRPGEEDPFVFHSLGSITEFKDEALRLIRVLNEMWADLGLPIKRDTDRGVDIPDTTQIWQALDSGHALHQIVKDNIQVVSFITSNVDIMKKACVVRGVTPGWWASSYAGKYAPEPKYFDGAVRCVVKAMHIIENSAVFKQVMADTARTMGDPLDTNTGYPFFSAQMDKEGRPVTRLKTLATFKGIGTANYDFDRLIKAIDDRAKGTGLEGWPFAIAPIRRSQPGYKWAHTFKAGTFGLQTDVDLRGYNTTRIAWMAPYILNLFLSPLQLRWKAIRKLMPGTFHDGAAKTRRMSRMKKTGIFCAEGDYTNYDRNMPVDQVLKLVKGYLANKPHPEYWLKMYHRLHHHIPIIWPDYVGMEGGRGLIFRPPIIGLLSGLKITAEEGTNTNVVVNSAALLHSGEMSEGQLVSYLTQYVDKAVGSTHESFFVQSDDALLLNSSLAGLKKQGDAFKASADAAGLKGSLELGDRFLMRHTFRGRDTPVPARVWQNTLSNEEPYEDPLKFFVALAMRSDGLLGHRTYDPFNIGTRIPVTGAEIKFTLEMLTGLRRFLQSAAKPVPDAIEFVNALYEACVGMRTTKLSELRTIDAEHAGKLDRMRKLALEMLAKSELQSTADGVLTNDALRTLIYSLHKQSNIPSSKLLLDQILTARPELNNVINLLANKENQFYNFAMNQLQIPLDL